MDFCFHRNDRAYVVLLKIVFFSIIPTKAVNNYNTGFLLPQYRFLLSHIIGSCFRRNMVYKKVKINRIG